MTISTVTAAPAFVRLSGLSEDEQAVRNAMAASLSAFRLTNRRQQEFYEGSNALEDLGIAIPPQLRDVESVVEWPGIVVDVLHERLDWKAWVSTGADLGLDAVFRQNHLAVEAPQGLLDALICGIAFMALGRGDTAAGEPEVLVTCESPNDMTAVWDPRTRRVRAALLQAADAATPGWLAETLYLPNENITLERRGTEVRVIDRDEHGMGRVSVARLVNRPTKSRPQGRSEITRAIRSLTNAGMRTALGMEVAREFYAAPQRWMMGAEESMFVDGDGERIDAWKAVIGRLLVAPRDEDGNLPTVGTFSASSPQPFTDQLRTLAQMVAAASGAPAAYFGFVADNPASADAIRSAESRLDKRALRAQTGLGSGVVDAGEIAVHLRDGEPAPPGLVSALWADPSTATPAADADFTQKMIAAGVLPPDSVVTQRRLKLTEVEIAQLAADRRRAQGSATLSALRSAASSATTDAQVAVLSAARSDPAGALVASPSVTPDQLG